MHKITTGIKENKFLKLIKYSKNIQQRLGIKLLDYIENYLKNKINFVDYLSNFYDLNIKNNKNEVSEKLKSDLLWYNIEADTMDILILNYFKKYYNNLNNKEISLYENSKDIELSSPFFDILYNNEFFDKIFNITISHDIIEKKQNEYKLNIDKLNKSNPYFSITYVHDGGIENIELLRDLNINFNNLKKLRIINQKKDRYWYFGEHIIKEINFINITNNLIYFEYEIPFKEKEKNRFFDLNKFNSLKYLYLSKITFYEIYELNLKNLEKLKKKECRNLALYNCDFQKLKYLEFDSNFCYLTENIKELDFPEINTLLLNSEREYNFEIINKLKIFKGEVETFYRLKNINSLEKIEFIDFYLDYNYYGRRRA